jgi:hypothetical protein
MTYGDARTSVIVAVLIVVLGRLADQARILGYRIRLENGGSYIYIARHLRLMATTFTSIDLVFSALLTMQLIGLEYYLPMQRVAPFVAITTIASLALRLRSTFGPTGGLWHESLIVFFGCSMLFSDRQLSPAEVTYFHAASAIWLLGSYEASGIAKLRSPEWHRPGLLRDILATDAYGLGPSRWLEKDSFLFALRLAQPSIVVLELAAATIMIPMPSTMLITALATFLLFHVANLSLMGLPQFFPPALSSLYSIAWLHQYI